MILLYPQMLLRYNCEHCNMIKAFALQFHPLGMFFLHLKIANLRYPYQLADWKHWKIPSNLFQLSFLNIMGLIDDLQPHSIPNTVDNYKRQAEQYADAN